MGIFPTKRQKEKQQQQQHKHGGDRKEKPKENEEEEEGKCVLFGNQGFQLINDTLKDKLSNSHK